MLRPGSKTRATEGAEGVEADLQEPRSLVRLLKGCETVFHLAGKAHDFGQPDSSEFQSVNVEGTRSLLEAAERAGARVFVFVSSVKAMGEGGDECLDEGSLAFPRSPYGVSKLEAERLVLETGLRTGMHVSVLRLPLVYGPGLKGNLRAMLLAIRRGSFPPPPRLANRRSLTSVEDVSSAILLAATNPVAAGRTYIVTDGHPYSSRGIYDAMREALGLPPRAWAIPLWLLRAAAGAGDVASRVARRPMPLGRDVLSKLVGSAWYSNERIRRELGFEPATDLSAALPAIVSTLNEAA